MVKIAIILLSYKNTEDVNNAINNIRKNDIDADIFIINSYYNDKTSEEISKIAKYHRVAFYKTIKNNGYGYGNNFGIKEAQKYNYDYYVVMNPDVEIIQFNIQDLRSYHGCVIGPKIIRNNGSNQNPYWFRRSSLAELLIYLGEKRRLPLLKAIGIVIHKVLKMLLVKKGMPQKVFALHGSFIIFHKSVIKILEEPYDDNIFLYTEEEDLAYKLNSLKVESFINPKIVVRHFEDGSSAHLENDYLKSVAKSSIIYRYEKWHK